MALNMEADRVDAASGQRRAGRDRGARALAYGLPALGLLTILMLLTSIRSLGHVSVLMRFVVTLVVFGAWL